MKIIEFVKGMNFGQWILIVCLIICCVIFGVGVRSSLLDYSDMIAMGFTPEDAPYGLELAQTDAIINYCFSCVFTSLSVFLYTKIR